MVNGVKGGGDDAFDAIRAAMARQAEAQQRIDAAADGLRSTSQETEVSGDFEAKLSSGLDELNAQVKGGDELIEGLVSGKVSDFHEVAAQVKQADLSFKFALAVRNKFIDAYREVMRMSV